MAEMQHQDFQVVVVTYNSLSILDSILEPIHKYNALVIDNASTDDSIQYIERNFPQVELIANPINIGYGRAANSAFEKISAPYALLLNPDIKIEQGQLLKLFSLTETLEGDWLYIAPNSGHTVKRINKPAPEGLKCITHATGCALLFNLNNFRKMNGFDKNVFLYYEEMDLSIRAHQAGLNMYYAENIFFPHSSKKSSTTSQKLDDLRNWHFQWSALYYKRKHALWKQYAASLIEYICLGWAKKLFRSEQKKRKVRIKQHATWAHLRNHSAFLPDGSPFQPE